MSLREEVLKGGAFLAMREGLGLVISLSGVLLLTRLIGPANYGLYAGPAAIVAVLVGVGRLGIDVCLIRRQATPDAALYDQAFTVLLLTGLGLALAGIGVVPLLTGWVIGSHFAAPLAALLATLPLSLATAPATARLERALNYRAIALTDMVGQAGYYAVALPLAALGAGVWAPVAGYWCHQVLVGARAYAVSGYRPRLTWSRSLTRELLGYGLAYASSTWLWNLRTLVNPLIVGSFLGPKGVGYVTLAIRFAEVLAFFRNVSWRLSIAALAKVQSDFPRLRQALEEAMTLQVLAVGPLLAGFSLLATPLVPWLFGTQWAPALTVFPLIALGTLVNVLFSMQSSVLYVLRRNRDVGASHLVHVALFALGAGIAVPRVGLVGYGIGEVLALGGYLILHVRLTRAFPFSYAQVLPWLGALVPPLFAVLLPIGLRPLLWLPLALVAARPRQRQQIRQYFGYVLHWRTA